MERRASFDGSGYRSGANHARGRRVSCRTNLAYIRRRVGVAFCAIEHASVSSNCASRIRTFKYASD